jgi:hypothetical protein
MTGRLGDQPERRVPFPARRRKFQKYFWRNPPTFACFLGGRGPFLERQGRFATRRRPPKRGTGLHGARFDPKRPAATSNVLEKTSNVRATWRFLPVFAGFFLVRQKNGVET